MNRQAKITVGILVFVILVLGAVVIYSFRNGKKEVQDIRITIVEKEGKTSYAQNIKEGTSIKELDIPKKEGYIFEFWEDENGTKLDDNYIIKEKQTIVAVFKEEINEPVEEKPQEKKVYSVIIVVDDKTEYKQIYEGDYIVQPISPTKEGYSFAGWESEGIPFDFSMPITKDTTIIAKWVKIEKNTKEYIVTFDSTGGSSIPAKKIVENGTINRPTNPTKKGYKFVEWRLNGKKFDFKTKITRNITLVAIWEKKESQPASVEKYKVTLNANGGKVNGNTSTVVTINKNQTGNIPTPVRNGYSFNGWFTATTGGTRYTKYSEVKKTMTLYAQWRKNEYKVIFNGNGGKVEKKNEVEKTITIDSELPTATRTNWTFAGWYTKKMGGSLIANAANINSNQTLYAQWKTKKYVQEEVFANFAENPTYTVSNPSVIKVTKGYVDQGDYLGGGVITKFTIEGLKEGTSILTFKIEESDGTVTYTAKHTYRVDKDLYIMLVAEEIID